MIDNELNPIGSEQRITKAAGDSLHPIASFGPDGNVGVLFRDDRQGQQDVWFTRLGCVAGGPRPLTRLREGCSTAVARRPRLGRPREAYESTLSAADRRLGARSRLWSTLRIVAAQTTSLS